MSTVQEFFDLEEKYGAHNYSCIPVVLEKGSAENVWDVEGKQYIDFMGAYGAVNQGHCHPKIVEALVKQASVLNIASRAFYNDKLGRYYKYVTELFGYDKLLPMNTGVEAGETAVKIARKWAYKKKGVAENQAVILFAKGGFWGRTIGAISASTDPDCYGMYGPFVPGFEKIEYNDIDALTAAMEANPNVCAFYVEPVQGEGGVIVPDSGYLKKAKEVCEKHNALLILDEIQSGLGRTGFMLAQEHDNVKADLVCLGKALSGGVYPVSAVLGYDETMLCIEPNTHGSTYGGNPLACVVAEAALKVLVDEKLCENAQKMGDLFRKGMTELQNEFPHIIYNIRGRGLMNGVEIYHTLPFTAFQLCVFMKEMGVLAKPTHKYTVRFTPPLVITKENIFRGLYVVRQAIEHFNKTVKQ